MYRVRGQPKGNNIMLLAVFEELKGVVAAIAIEEKEARIAYPFLTPYSRIEVLKLFETKLVIRIA